MQKQIGLTDARGKFSEIVNEVMYREDTYIISKMGKPAVAVVPLSILREWQEQREKEFAVIKRIQAQNADSPAAQMEDEELLDTMNDLVHEARAQSNS